MERHDSRQTGEDAADLGALHALAAAVDETHGEEPPGAARAEVLLDDGRDVARRESVAVDLPCDGNLDGLGVALCHSLNDSRSEPLPGVSSTGLESTPVATTPADCPPGDEGSQRLAFRIGPRTDDTADAPSAPDEEALAAFRRAAWLNPEEADYQYILGDALLRAGRFMEAAAAFEEATWRAGKDAQYHLGLGVALHALKRDLDAASAFREAARLAPDEPRARCGLGASLVTLGQVGEGIRELRQAVVLAPADADAHFNLGLALAASGQSEEALDSLRPTPSLSPSWGARSMPSGTTPRPTPPSGKRCASTRAASTPIRV